MTEMTLTCSECGAPIIMAQPEFGRPFALNATPDPQGPIWIGDDGRVRYRTGLDPAPDGVPRYTSHFKTCPAAAPFRRES